MYTKHIYSTNLLIPSQDIVHAVAQADGIRHLISMATSEHVIMQNEALVALAIASAIDIGNVVSDTVLIQMS